MNHPIENYYVSDCTWETNEWASDIYDIQWPEPQTWGFKFLEIKKAE